MNKHDFLSRILIIDDLLGRRLSERRNEQRANFCGQYLIEDVTGDEVGTGAKQKIKRPVAQAVFCRGQKPAHSIVGDIVENDVSGTLEIIRKGWERASADNPRWSLVLLDLCFYTGRITEVSDRSTPGMPEGRDGDDAPGHYFGLTLLRALHEEFPDLPVVIISAQPRDEVSRQFSQYGARGFLPREATDSPTKLREYIDRHGLIPDESGDLVGGSKQLFVALRAARIAAANRQNILIRGERGVGKELLARYIHRQRPDAKSAPLVEINSAILAPDLFTAELFGIESGIATNVAKRDGRIHQAQGGDLFLDEIKDMPPQVQAGVLKVLEEREITPVGAKNPISVDVRFISATNSDIEALAATERFRPDLLDRLRQGGTIVLPPLRERKEDIPLLAEKFVREAERKHASALTREINSDALDQLRNYDWPGNIRELRDCMFAAVNGHPDLEHLVPIHLRLGTSAVRSIPPIERSEPPTTPASSRSLPSGSSLAELLRLMKEFGFDSLKQEDLAGMLPDIQKANAQLLANFLKATLEATATTTKDSNGITKKEIFISRAMNLATGDSRLPTSRAADLIKRLLSRDPDSKESLPEDPILREALETSLRLRPKGPKQSN